MSYHSFESIVPMALEAAGLDFDPKSIASEEVWGSKPSMVAEDPVNHLDIHIKEGWPRGHTGVTNQLLPYSFAKPQHQLRGLIRYEQGHFSVDDPAYTSFSVPVRVALEALTSPEGVNRAQQSLGREPGKDAFKLTRKPEYGFIRAGQYVESFAEMQAPAARLTDWGNAKHDLEPHFHLQTWWTSPPSVCEDVTNYTQSLVDQYGEKIHLEDEEHGRAPEIGQFTGAMDDLFIYTGDFLHAVYAIEAAAATTKYGSREYKLSPMATIHDLVKRCGKIVLDPEWGGIEGGSWANMLERIGVINKDLLESERLQKAQRTAQAYVVHIATMFLNLEEVKPKAEDSSHRRNARVNLLNQVVKQFSV